MPTFASYGHWHYCFAPAHLHSSVYLRCFHLLYLHLLHWKKQLVSLSCRPSQVLLLVTAFLVPDSESAARARRAAAHGTVVGTQDECEGCISECIAAWCSFLVVGRVGFSGSLRVGGRVRVNSVSGAKTDRGRMYVHKRLSSRLRFHCIDLLSRDRGGGLYWSPSTDFYRTHR